MLLRLLLDLSLSHSLSYNLRVGMWSLSHSLRVRILSRSHNLPVMLGLTLRVLRVSLLMLWKIWSWKKL
jgi:hypothetical protein